MPTMPQSAAGWRMEPPVSLPSAQSASPAATAAAEPPLLPPGTVLRSHGLARDLVRRVLGARAHGELVQVGLAEHDHVVFPHLAHRRGGVDRLVVVEDLRGAGGGDALGDHVVLDGDGQARQRAAHRLHLAVDLGRVLGRVVRRVEDVGAHLALHRGDLVQVHLGQLGGRDLPVHEQPFGVARGETQRVERRHLSPSSGRGSSRRSRRGRCAGPRRAAGWGAPCPRA